MSDLYENLVRDYRKSLARQDYKMAAVAIMSIVNMALHNDHNPVALIQEMITPSEIATLDDVLQDQPLQEHQVNKKEFHEFLVKAYVDGANAVVTVDHIMQDRPSTAVEVVFLPGTKSQHTAFGFSKVCYPDKFDAEIGLDRAVRKALSKLAARPENIAALESKKISDPRWYSAVLRHYNEQE